MTVDHKGQSNPQRSETFTEEDPLQPNGVTETVKKKTCCENLLNGLRNITVEPVLSLFIVAAIVNHLTSQNLSIEKACRVTLKYPSEICDSLRAQKLESQNQYEREVQRVIAQYITYKTYITATVPSIISLFAGSFSDKTGRRKLFLIIPLCGQIILCANNIFNTYFFYELGLNYLFFSEAILEGISGGWSVPMFTVFAYISTITTEKNRTFRMGLLNFALTVGFPVGMGLSGVMLKNYGFYGAYILAISCHSFNLMYTLVVLKDPPRSTEQMKYDNKGCAKTAKTFFSLANIREALRVLFKGPNNRRSRILTYMAVVCILFGPMHGELSVLYLSTRYRFGWDELKFSIFQTYNFILHTIGTIFSITVFSKVLGWHDSVLGIISTVSRISAAFVYAFASTGNMFFVAPIIDVLNGTSMLAMRSIISKFVESNELGKVNSIISLTENLMPLIFVPVYTSVYRLTMETLPGTVFLLGAALTIPAVVVFVLLFVEHLRNRKKVEEKDPAKLPLENGLTKLD